MKRLRIILIALAIPAISACVPLSELDEMEAVMTSRVDSLDLQLNECRAQSQLYLDRMAAIERENLQLDDQNRLLAARLAELQYSDSTLMPVTGARDVPSISSPTAVVPEPASPDRETTIAAADAAPPDVESGTTTPAAFNPSITPDIEYLRKYQEALRQHQSNMNDLAYMSFESLLNAPPNDMADNCLYWMAESEIKSGRHERAAGLFSSVLLCTPSDKAPAALLGRARARIALERIAEAREDLERLRGSYPRTPEAEQATSLLRSLR